MVISINGFTAARSQEIEDSAIVGGAVDGSGDLILSRHDGGTINAGAVVGPSGPAGSGLIVCTSSTRPGAPNEGDMIWETDTNRIYVWPGGAWRWIWSQSGEDRVRLKIAIGADDDAIGPETWPSALEVSVDVPIWAKEIEAIAVIDQVQQVTSLGNTSLELLLGSGVIKGKRIRWAVTGADGEKDITLMGNYDCSAMAGSTQLLRVKAERLSGSGALRVDNESGAYLSARFTDT